MFLPWCLLHEFAYCFHTIPDSGADLYFLQLFQNIDENLLTMDAIDKQLDYVKLR